MRKTFITFFIFLILAFIAFLLLSKNGFLGEDLGKKGEEISSGIDRVFSQGKDAIADFTGLKEEKPAVPQEDPKITKFFKQLKTATPEVLSEMVVNGFNPRKANLAGEPPIVYMARYNDNPETYDIMLNIGANAAQTNKKGENALKVALERGAPLEIIRKLYANQEEIDAQKRLDKINEGPGAQVIGSYYPSIEKEAQGVTKGNRIYIDGYSRNKNLKGLE